VNTVARAPDASPTRASRTPDSRAGPRGLSASQKVLLVCGILSSLLYVATDIFAALQYRGYSYAAQGVSELNAVGAPTRPFTLPLFTLDNVFLLAFGVAVWALADRNRALRFTGALLVADAVVGQLGLQFFNMDPRVAGRTPRTAMHEVVTGVEVLVILSAIGVGAAALGKRFRFYSIATLLAVLVCGVVTFWIVETRSSLMPWLGVTERINIYAYMLWKLVLAAALLRARDVGYTPCASGVTGA
jgi:uncharacterized protein DUF998